MVCARYTRAALHPLAARGVPFATNALSYHNTAYMMVGVGGWREGGEGGGGGAGPRAPCVPPAPHPTAHPPRRSAWPARSGRPSGGGGTRSLCGSTWRGSTRTATTCPPGCTRRAAWRASAWRGRRGRRGRRQRGRQMAVAGSRPAEKVAGGAGAAPGPVWPRQTSAGPLRAAPCWAQHEPAAAGCSSAMPANNHGCNARQLRTERHPAAPVGRRPGACPSCEFGRCSWTAGSAVGRGGCVCLQGRR